MSIARQRLISQRLAGEPFDSAAETVAWFGAVQSQDYPNAKWGLAQRMRATTDAQLEAAFARGEIVRTHVLRPTWHFVAARDLRWLLSLTGPRVQAANARVYRQHELDGRVLRRAHDVIARVLTGHNCRTRAQLADELHKKGIAARGQRMTFVAMHAELEGLICSGPLQGKQHTYMLAAERVPPGVDLQGDEAAAELARRYFRSHGPASAHDFAWWSGFTLGAARRAIDMLGTELATVTHGGRTMHLSAAQQTSGTVPSIHLLPNYDEHVVAYRDHQPSLDPAAPDALRNWGNALTTHLVVRNGLIVGGWRRTHGPEHTDLQVTLQVPLNGAERSRMARAAAAYGRFLGRPVHVSA